MDEIDMDEIEQFLARTEEIFAKSELLFALERLWRRLSFLLNPMYPGIYEISKGALPDLDLIATENSADIKQLYGLIVSNHNILLDEIKKLSKAPDEKTNLVNNSIYSMRPVYAVEKWDVPFGRF